MIARAGLASRREAEAWIAAGRVAVNGKLVASPALNVGARDRIEVDGQPLPTRERTRLFLYHKPRGLLTTHADPGGRPTIFGVLPKELPRLISVGRLDLNTEGLLLLTNDGGLARALELPATGWLRRYRVRAHGSVAQAQLDALRRGITIDGVRYGEIEATVDRSQGSNVWLTFAIREGKNREVKNVLGHLGLAVNRLIRVSFGPFRLGDLSEGAIEEVKTRTLRDQLGDRIAALAGADFSGPRIERDRIERETDAVGCPAPSPGDGRPRRSAQTGGAFRAGVPRRPGPPRASGCRRAQASAAYAQEAPARCGAFRPAGTCASGEKGARPPVPAGQEALMRIVGGRLRGRLLAAPASQAIRPTADRLRESLFNILVHAYGDPITDARVLDLFAGTGALGLEALSRGAAFALFIDEGAEARALLRENVATLGLGGTTRIFRRDATKLGAAHPIEPFSVAFLDPPYGRGLAEQALASARERVDGSRPARWWSWKRPPNPVSPRPKDSMRSNGAITTTARSSCCDTVPDALIVSPR